ncbi:MAG TPA: hypothetical protein VGI40_20935 [Pirellulaceae bacterium]
MLTSASLSPEPRIPSPPSPRDFEIHRLSLVEFFSTRRLAEKYEISQTRVRQIIAHVSDWLTEMLPVKSEQDIEKEKRFAIHLAAAQLRHQIQQLQNYWDGSGDPKYLRQQTRAIQALARLGAHSHTLDSLAANSGAGFQPAESCGAGFQPAENGFSDDSPETLTRRASEDESVPNPTAPGASAASSAASLSPPPPLSPSPPFSIPNSSFPPEADCSPSTPSSFSPHPSSFGEADLTPSPETDLLLQPENARDTLKGLEILERNLLT